MTDQQPSVAIWSRFGALEEEIAPWTEDELKQVTLDPIMSLVPAL